MGILKFDNLPVNTLIGADRDTLNALYRSTEADAPYRNKMKATKLIQGILNPFYRMNERCWEKMEEPKMQAPVFILGHWRSGTTFVHNVLSCDRQFGFCSTYQTVFPHLMLRGSGFFKSCMSFFIPSNRPTDSLELRPDLPQEEEFALVNMMPYSFYNFWSFPKNMDVYREKYLLFNGMSKEEMNVFKSSLDKLIKIALHCQGKEVFLSKNPPHTGRIRTLLEMYPEARFIYLVRNPYTVFESTKNFFGKTLKSLQVQEISEERLEKEIITTYKEMIARYEQDKHLIPAGHLAEIRFEDFEASPLDVTQDLYSRLSLGDFNESKEEMEKYLSGRKGFKKNRYAYSGQTVRTVEANWQDTINRWGYSL